MTTNQAIIEALKDISKEITQVNQSLDRLLPRTTSPGKHVKEHEYTTGKYDWQVSQRDYATMMVSAYSLILNSEGDVVGRDSTVCVSLYVPMDLAHTEVLQYLMGDYFYKTWDGYASWVDEDFLSCKEAPAVVQAFVKSVNQLTHKEFTRIAKESQND